MKKKILAFITAAMCFAGVVPVNATAENSDKGVVGLQEEGGSRFDGLTISKGTKQLTLSEVIPLSKKGDKITWSDFEPYAGDWHGTGMYTHICTYDLGGGFFLLVEGNPPEEPAVVELYRDTYEKRIDIRKDDIDEFMGWALDFYHVSELDTAEIKMTLDDVISLSKKGNALDWADFKIYSGQESGHGYTDWMFELEDGYTLRVRGESKDKAPETITLYRNDQIKGCEEIDIRTDNVEAFLESKQYYFNEIGSMTKSELKALFAKKGLTEDKGYGVWTKEEVAAVLKDNTITVSLKPDARYVTKDGIEVLNETSSIEEFLKYDEYNIVQANYLDFATKLPRDEIFLLFINSELRTEVNEKGEYIYRRYFKYRFGSMYSDEETQIKKITTAMNYLQLNPYFDGFELNTDAAYGGTSASTVKARVLDINEKTLLLQSVSNCDDRYLLFNEQINNDITPTAGMELDITYDGGMFKLDSVMTIGDVKKVSVVSEKNEFLKGDTNCDGGVDMADAVLIMQALANPNKFGEFNTEFNYLTALGRLNGDMNGDGLTVGDAQAIQRKLLGLDYESSEDMPKLSNIVTINNDYFPNKGNSKEIGILLEFDSKEYPIALTASEGGFVIENKENSTGKYTILGNTCEVDKNVKLIWKPLADYMTYDYEFKFSPERLDIELLVEGIDGDKRIELGKIYITQVERTKFTASLDAKVVSPYRSVIAGKTFVYEKEGVGSDFTITFNSDGTYVYYEGVLSSYIGAGTWKVTDNIVLMTEGVSKKVNNLKINGSDLVYIADASDNFYYITVKDGEKFSVQSLSAQLDKIRDQLSKFFASEKIDYTVISKDKMPEQFADQYVFIKVNTTDTSYAALYGAFLKASDIDSSLIKSIPYKVDSDTELNKIRELLYCYILENNISASVDPTDEEADLINKTVLVKYADSSETRSQLEDFLKEKNIDLNLVEFYTVE